MKKIADGTIPVRVHHRAVHAMAKRNGQMARALHALADRVEAEFWPMPPDVQSRLLVVVEQARAVAEGVA